MLNERHSSTLASYWNVCNQPAKNAESLSLFLAWASTLRRLVL